MPKVKTLIIQFETPLRRAEVPLFRGAIIALVPSKHIFFHNHRDNGLRYAYPLIQYKRIGGKASLVCIDEGVEAVGELLAAHQHTDVAIGQTKTQLTIARINAMQTEVQCWNSQFNYRLRDWLPLNEENYKVYSESESIIQRMTMLEKILIGNILSFAKGMHIRMDNTIEVTITAIENQREVHYKHVPLTCMDIEFKCNVSLPDFVGIGKHASVGFGIITRKNQNKSI